MSGASRVGATIRHHRCSIIAILFVFSDVAMIKIGTGATLCTQRDGNFPAGQSQVTCQAASWTPTLSCPEAKFRAGKLPRASAVRRARAPRRCAPNSGE